MKRVFTGINLADTTHLKNLLEQSSIGCFIKNTYLGAAVGDLPVFDVSPEIWVFADAHAASARHRIGLRCKTHASTSNASTTTYWSRK